VLVHGPAKTAGGLRRRAARRALGLDRLHRDVLDRAGACVSRNRLLVGGEDEAKADLGLLVVVARYGIERRDRDGVTKMTSSRQLDISGDVLEGEVPVESAAEESQPSTSRKPIRFCL
jgi:hypothetical protein